MQSLREINSALSTLGLKHGNILIFCELPGGHESLKVIYFCWQHFAGNDFRAFLAGKQRIKFSLKGLILYHF